MSLHTLKTLEYWEEVTGDDVILDGPYTLRKEDQDKFLALVNKEYGKNETDIDTLIELIIDEALKNNVDILYSYEKTREILATVLNEGNYPLMIK